MMEIQVGDGNVDAPVDEQGRPHGIWRVMWDRPIPVRKEDGSFFESYVREVGEITFEHGKQIGNCRVYNVESPEKIVEYLQLIGFDPYHQSKGFKKVSFVNYENNFL